MDAEAAFNNYIGTLGKYQFLLCVLLVVGNVSTNLFYFKPNMSFAVAMPIIMLQNLFKIISKL